MTFFLPLLLKLFFLLIFLNNFFGVPHLFSIFNSTFFYSGGPHFYDIGPYNTFFCAITHIIQKIWLEMGKNVSFNQFSIVRSKLFY
jgi:hypothetical protein